jgi:DNA-binding NarL/FixJ family response regulator
MNTLRVVLADDHELIRKGVLAVLDAIPGVETVGECGDLDELMAAVARLEPNVVVTDIRMPPTGTDEGIRAAIAIREQRPDVGVVVLSQFAEPEYVLQLFENGSSGLGYLLKDRVTPAELTRAITAVAAGDSAVDGAIVEVLVTARGRRASPIDSLTPRENEVLACIAEGLNNAAVAERLVLSEKAVAKHINSIFSKLDLGFEEQSHRRVKAVLMWLADRG